MFRPLGLVFGPLSLLPRRTDPGAKDREGRSGISNTAAVSEILHGDGTFSRLRVNWNTPKQFNDPNEYDEFASYCAAIPPLPMDYGWRGVSRARGLPWVNGNIGFTMYVHILAPNQPSCYNGTDVQAGISSTASAHDGGVNLIYADGHAGFIGNSIDIDGLARNGVRRIGSTGVESLISRFHQ